MYIIIKKESKIKLILIVNIHHLNIKNIILLHHNNNNNNVQLDQIVNQIHVYQNQREGNII